jgi:hypothetical protein
MKPTAALAMIERRTQLLFIDIDVKTHCLL